MKKQSKVKNVVNENLIKGGKPNKPTGGGVQPQEKMYAIMQVFHIQNIQH